ncbi:helix-turn-helix transcriptional regulator [Paenibacillus contaminans]|uniref:HTH araC/xylS-type domain-containing protein n=1 Tax=Paenibacillus contaminans TaxID=450362 RepID=A0A329LT78_9BACL|nr:AraC family transcriptional regulator [Paenibacillus contaminans]RAV10929.1 hypothetical protein DQG23_37080 [Paenibacillus contaminans]
MDSADYEGKNKAECSTLSIEQTEAADSAESSQHRAVKEAIDQMLRRIDDPTLSLGALAKTAYYSPFHFDRIFRSITGIPPRLYLSALRFQWSKKLLARTSRPATDIGQAVGYSSFGTFSSKFSQLIGLSPQQFRAFIEKSVLGLRELQPIEIAEECRERGVSGLVEAPNGFQGIICVGLFPKPIPMGKPIGCTVVFESGAYWIPDIPDGTYSVMSIAFSWEDSLEEYIHPQKALRGKAAGKLTIASGSVKGDTGIVLRPPKFYDPPMLVSFPILIQAFMERLEREKTAN